MLVMGSHIDIRSRKQDYSFLNNMPYWRGFIFICLLCINVHVSNDTMQFKYKSFLGNIPTDMEPWDSWSAISYLGLAIWNGSPNSLIYYFQLFDFICSSLCYVVYFVHLAITIVFALHLRVGCIDADQIRRSIS